MNREEMQTRLLGCAVLTEVPDSKAQEALEAVLSHEGFFILYGLMLGTRQTLFAALSRAPLGDGDQVWRAAVLQGKINGIEVLFNTAIEVLSPANPSAGEEQKEQR